MRTTSPSTSFIRKSVLSISAALLVAAAACSPLRSGRTQLTGALASGVQPIAASMARAAGATTAAAAADELSLEDLYVRANPAVVNITAVSAAADSPAFQSLPGFHQQLGPQSGPAVAEGSGFVYDQQGHIITNNHVVDGAKTLVVTFADGVEVAAQVVGASPDTDLAVLKVKVDASELQPLALGESDSLKVGQTVVAIGNPFGLEGSMTTGIVSGLGRLLDDGGQAADGRHYSLPDIIQTDAAINPGNSGGPLLDLAGDVIGVNTAIESPVRASSGVGYAIPVDLVRQVVPELIQGGSYHVPYLGISGQTLHVDLARAMKVDPQQHGVLVVDVAAGSPAAHAGLQGSRQETQIDGLPARIGGDVIVSIDDHPVSRFGDLLSYLVRHTEVGQSVALKVLRNGKTVPLEVKLAARPTSN